MPDPYKSLAIAMIIQAVLDARDDPSARAWLIDPAGGLHYLDLIDIEPPRDFETWVLSGCPKRSGGIIPRYKRPNKKHHI